MKILLVTEDAIRLEPTPGPMTIEAERADQVYSPFHMLGSGLAFCTYSVLQSWAANAKIDTADLTIEVSWTFADEPHRVAAIRERIVWPSLPDSRRRVAERVAALCAVHATFQHPPTVSVEVDSGVAAPGAPAGTSPAAPA